MNKFKKIFRIFILTLIVMTLTLFAPTKSNTTEQRKNLLFGYPLSFVSADYSSFDITETKETPIKYFLTNPRQYPMYVIWNNFIISFFVWFIFIGLLFLMFSKFIKNNHTFEIILRSLLFLFTIIAFLKFPAEIFIILLLTTLITQAINEYTTQAKFV